MKPCLYRPLIGVGLMVLISGCADSPVDSGIRNLSSGSAALVQVSAGDGQTADINSDVATAPAVIVKNANGVALPGVSVTFVVKQGGGSVGSPTAITNAQGIASAGSWTLGGTPGINEVDAVVGSLAPVHFTATALQPAPPPPIAGAFSITIRWLASGTLRQQQAVTSAAARWESIISSDLSSIPMTAPAATCFSTQPAINEMVDDVLIFVELVSIDGAGKVLGEAGPCYVRSDDGLPVVGHLKLDTADLQQMETYGTLDDVVLHEMGHILGIGTLWSDRNLLLGVGTPDPTFTGLGAVAAYNMLGGPGASVPVENTGTDGTRDGHWRESVFGNELMTGYIGGTPNPVSALTIASLQDLGYGANPNAASGYTLGGSSQNLTNAVDLRDREHVKKPRFKVDRHGKRSDNRKPLP